MDPTESETACFEAGIKFGTLYHQFAGTPVSPESAESLGRAMEEAIENQPHCADVQVTMRTDRIEAELADQSAEYTEFTGRFADVTMTIEYEGTTVETSMSMEGDYPMMRVDSVAED
ncbi:dihydroneopterin aldolase family protein [Haloarchaeobius amylolyticus]|uniref:dihydroneopterin aldolase family protein n=1 Tax=Haloarchaeobius amylolyticus TaxID=1198296 RepID=UPI0022709042|nr:dihydroneopterin aldolase family protein [Haloarchaeobius amylolyticus]